jgi:hypothetical protein
MTTIDEHLAAPSELRPGAVQAVSHKDVHTPPSRTATPSLTPHARNRAAQMGVPTKQVKRAIQFPDCTYPARDGRTISVAGALAVVHAHGVVITVLWNAKEDRDCVPIDLPSTTRSLSTTGQAA